MDILINTDGLKLTAELKDIIEDKIGRVEDLAPRAVRARVYLRKISAHSSQRQYLIHVLCELPGHNVSAEDSGPDPVTVIDLVSGKLQRQLRKRKADRLTQRHRLAREKERRRG